MSYQTPKPAGWKKVASEALSLEPTRKTAKAMVAALRKNKGLGKIWK